MTGSDKELFEFDCYRLDPAEHLLLRDGEPVPLEPKVFETLLVLLKNSGRLVAKEELMQAVWPDSFVEESNLTRNISVLRKALNRPNGGPQYIETVSKRGYRFVGDVRLPADKPDDLILQTSKIRVLVEEESDEQTNEHVNQARGGSSVDGSESTNRKLELVSTTRSRKLNVTFALVIVAAIVAAGVYFRLAGGNSQTIDSLAVLPFANVGGDHDDEYLSDGITDSLINSLSQLPGLTVMSHNSVFHFRGNEEAQAAGKQLGVRAVLTGRVVTRGDSLSITAELVDTRDNAHLWGEHYNRKLSELQAIEADLSREISEKLGLKLSSEDKQRLIRHNRENAEVYELYLKGRYALNSLTEQQQKGIEYFQRAIEIDSRYAPAHAGLAECYAELGDLGSTTAIPPREAFSKAKAEALAAVELDDTLPEAHTSLGMIAMFYEWDWNGAEREFQRAIALNPNYVSAHHWYSHYLINLGRFDDSLVESQRALDLDPLDVAMNYHLGFHYFTARQYDRAIAQLQKALDMDRNHNGAHAVLGLVYEQWGRYREAIEELEKSMELGGTDSRGNLGHVYAVSGRSREAQQLLDKLQEEAKNKPVSPYSIAVIYEGLSDKDKAFDWLERAYAERDGNVTNPGIKVDQELDGLRSDPRFADLLWRIGLAQ